MRARRVEDTIQRDDANVLALRVLGHSEFPDDSFQSADGRMELSHDMNNLHVIADHICLENSPTN
jgi:hypothetical protein